MYVGAEANISVKECTKIPTWFTSRAFSVKTNNNCVILYKNANCKTIGKNGRTLELRRGTPLLHNFQPDWQFLEIKAISHCGFKCDNKLSANKTGYIGLEQGEVALFDSVNYDGLKI